MDLEIFMWKTTEPEIPGKYWADDGEGVYFIAEVEEAYIAEATDGGSQLYPDEIEKIKRWAKIPTPEEIQQIANESYAAGLEYERNNSKSIDNLIKSNKELLQHLKNERK